MKRILLIIFFVANIICTSAQSSKIWSLDDCIKYAMEHNLSVRRVALEVDQGRVDLNAAKGKYLPSIYGTASENLSFGRGLSADNTYVNKNTTATSFSFDGRMTLFQGLQRGREVKMQKLNLRALTASLEKTREDITVAIMQVYMEVLYAQEQLAVSKKQAEIDAEQLARLENLYEGGKINHAALSAQKSSLAKTQVAVVKAENNLELTILELTQLLDLPSPKGFLIQLSDADDLPRRPLLTIGQIYERAVNLRPSIKAEELRLDYYKQSIKYYKGEYSPILSLSGGIGTNFYTTSGLSNPSFQEQLRNHFSQYVGLTLSIPIFNRLDARDHIKSAKIAYQTQAITLDETKKTLYNEIQQVYYNTLAAYENHKSCQAAVESAQETFLLMKEQYESEKITLAEFNEAKYDLAAALSEQARAMCECFYFSRLLEFYQK